MKFKNIPIHICNNIPIKNNIWLAPPNQTICPFCGEKMNNEDRIEKRHGSPTFYSLLNEMAETHDKKSHDYATNDNPFGNYLFAGVVANMFAHSSLDAGFSTRLAEKIYRLSILEGGRKTPRNESIDDTERDIATITALWMAARRNSRNHPINQSEQAVAGEYRGKQAIPTAQEMWKRTSSPIAGGLMSIEEQNQQAVSTILATSPVLTEEACRGLADYFRRMADDLNYEKRKNEVNKTQR